jgi:hypothetical protein
MRVDRTRWRPRSRPMLQLERRGMGVPREVFDEDYLYFYWEVLTNQRADLTQR